MSTPLNFFGVKARQVSPSLVAVAGTKITDGGYTMRGGVCILDITDPAKPAPVGQLLDKTNCGFYGMAVSEAYLYCAGGPLGIHIIDLSRPSDPQAAPTYNVPGPGWCWDVFIEGNLAYVADAQAGIKILDLTDPLQPRLLGECDTPMNAREIIVRDSIAYVADYHGMSVIDVSEPSAPTIIGGYRSLAMGLKLQGKYAYLACSPKGMLVLDISNPRQPKKAGDLANIRDQATTVRLDVSGDRAVWATGPDGLIVADISDPTKPAHIRHVPVPGTAYDVITVGDWAMVAETSNALFTHKFRP